MEAFGRLGIALPCVPDLEEGESVAEVGLEHHEPFAAFPCLEKAGLTEEKRDVHLPCFYLGGEAGLGKPPAGSVFRTAAWSQLGLTGRL